jgi:hypothetical protein
VPVVPAKKFNYLNAHFLCLLPDEVREDSIGRKTGEDSEIAIIFNKV